MNDDRGDLTSESDAGEDTLGWETDLSFDARILSAVLADDISGGLVWPGTGTRESAPPEDPPANYAARRAVFSGLERIIQSVLEIRFAYFLVWIPQASYFDAKFPFLDAPDLIDPLQPISTPPAQERASPLLEPRLISWIDPPAGSRFVPSATAARVMRELRDGRPHRFAPRRPFLNLSATPVSCLTLVPSARHGKSGEIVLAVVGCDASPEDPVTDAQQTVLKQCAAIAFTIMGYSDEPPRLELDEPNPPETAHKLALNLFHNAVHLLGYNLIAPSASIEMRLAIIEKVLDEIAAMNIGALKPLVRERVEHARTNLERAARLTRKLSWIGEELTAAVVVADSVAVNRVEFDLLQAAKQEYEGLPVDLKANFAEPTAVLPERSVLSSLKRGVSRDRFTQPSFAERMRQSFTVTGDEGLTRRAIRYLLRTAVTELPSDWHRRRKVRVGVRQGAAQVILSIEVEGPGLRPSQARRVWDPVLGPLLPPLKDDMRAAGLGPYLARRIINLQNTALGHNLFRIGLENWPETETRPARGYCYYLAIPIRPMERRRGA